MIFVLDDDRYRLAWFKLFFGPKVHRACTVSDALGYLRSNKYDTVYLDHDLGGPFTEGPDGDGIDVAKVMRDEQLQTDAIIWLHSCNPAGREDMMSTLKDTHKHVEEMAYPRLKEHFETLRQEEQADVLED